MKLSFSTLGCPSWSYAEILIHAAEYGFQGIALRGLKGELDPRKIPEFEPSRRAETRRLAEKAGLTLNLLGTSSKLVVAEAELAASAKEARENIDLAADLAIPFVRFFGGMLPVGLSFRAATLRAGERLRALADYGAGRGVKILLETHDDWLRPACLRAALEAADHTNAGVLWDVHHPYRIAEISLQGIWQALGPWIAGIDLKDSREDLTAPLGYRYVPFGEGEIPLRKALALARGGGYDGWLTFEWEKLWHPEIEEPEIVFPAFVSKIGEWLPVPNF